MILNKYLIIFLQCFVELIPFRFITGEVFKGAKDVFNAMISFEIYSRDLRNTYIKLVYQIPELIQGNPGSCVQNRLI